MNGNSTLRSIRVLLVTLALALASTLGSVPADVLTPLEDNGSPGGGGSGYADSEPAPQAEGPYVTR